VSEREKVNIKKIISDKCAVEEEEKISAVWRKREKMRQ
jgi:hypothetical protein